MDCVSRQCSAPPAGSQEKPLRPYIPDLTQMKLELENLSQTVSALKNASMSTEQNLTDFGNQLTEIRDRQEQSPAQIVGQAQIEQFNNTAADFKGTTERALAVASAASLAAASLEERLARLESQSGQSEQEACLANIEQQKVLLANAEQQKVLLANAEQQEARLARMEQLLEEVLPSHSKEVEDEKLQLQSQEARLCKVEKQMENGHNHIVKMQQYLPGNEVGLDISTIEKQQAVQTLDSTVVNQPSARTLDHDLDSIKVYHPEESIVDATVILCGDRTLPPITAVILAIGFIFSAFLQVVAIVFCFQLFTSEPFDRGLVTRFHYWRTAQGHVLGNVDPFSGHSMAARVCAQDPALTMSYDQKSSISQVNDFLNDGQGTLLCNLALILWALCCCQELRHALTLFEAMWSVNYVEVEGIFKKQIRPPRRVFGLFVALCQAAGALGLLYCGSYWLARTPSIRELLLNASALGFVLEIDEIMYGTLASSLVRGLMSSFEPIHLPESYTLNVLPVAMIIIMLGFTIIVNLTYIDGLVSSMQDVRDVLCSADTNLDFMADTNALGWLMYADSNPFPRIGADAQEAIDAASEAVKAKLEVVELIINNDPKASIYAINASQLDVDKSLLHMREMVSKSPEELVSYRPCSDVVDAQAFRLIYAATGKQVFKVAESCAELSSFCRGPASSLASINVRRMCPVTCGCGNPTSGLWDLANPRAGCPRQACDQAISLVRASPLYECEDRNVTEVFTSNWSFMLGRMHNSSVIDGALFKNLSDMGCRGLAYMNDHALRSKLCSHGVFLGAGMMCPVSCGCLHGNRLSLPVPEEPEKTDGYLCPHYSCQQRWNCLSGSANSWECQSDATYYIRQGQTSLNWGHCEPSGVKESCGATDVTRAKCMQRATLACDTSSTCTGFAILSLQFYSMYVNFSCVHDQAVYLYIKPQTMCNPTYCAEKWMCMDWSCSVPNDGGACGESPGENVFSCPIDNVYGTTCRSKICTDRQEACNDHGGVEFSALPCESTFTFERNYLTSCCEDSSCKVNITTSESNVATAMGTGQAWSPSTGSFNGANLFMFGISGLRTFDRITWSDGCVWKVLECAMDSNECIAESPGWAYWWTCRALSAEDCVDWSKDTQRCCPQKCGVDPICDEIACNNLTGSGSCVYPNAALT